MRLSTFALGVCLGTAPVLQAAQPPSSTGSPSEPLQIFYTGDTKGYLRLPDRQMLEPGREKAFYLKSNVKESGSPAARRMLDLLGRRPAGVAARTLTLGMGDNFAMDYFSRVAIVALDHAAESEEADADPGPGDVATPQELLRFIPKDELVYDDKKDGWWDIEAADASTLSSIEIAELTGLTSSGFDNVAEFFRKAKYDALVPGKHDFYYGPERLRQLARYLARPAPASSIRPAASEPDSEQPVRILGANLVIQSSYARPGPAQPEHLVAKQRWYFVKDELKLGEMAKQPMQWALPKSVLPWNRRFRLRNAYPEGQRGDRQDFSAEALLCRLGKGGGKDDCEPLREMPYGRTLDFRVEESEAEFVVEDHPLIPGRRYVVCVKRPQADRPFCRPFAVLTPFFHYPDLMTPSAHAPKPYLVKKGADAVVFGVVEFGLEKLVGQLNASWKNLRPDTDTQMQTIDPAEALVQVLDYCEDQGDCDAATRSVLMAHMPRVAAQMLARGLEQQKRPMTIVLSRADDAFATAPHRVDYAAGHPTVTLTPREPFNSANELLTLQTACLVSNGDTQQLSTWSIGLDTPSPSRLECSGGGQLPAPSIASSDSSQNAVHRDNDWKASYETLKTDSFEKELGAAWCSLKNQLIRLNAGQAEDFGERFRTITLRGLQDYLDADVALMQDRDFYKALIQFESPGTPCPEQPPSHVTTPGEDKFRRAEKELMEAAIEQILWKGDFAYARTLKGSALRAALAESDRLGSLEQDVYSIESETGRSLVYLGLVKDTATGNWYVNGVPLENNRLYSVAMTDFLAFGDTGYPSLQTPAAPPARRVAEITSLPRLSDLVLDQICDLGGGCEYKPPQINYDQYVDYSKHQPFEAVPEANRWHLARQALAQGMKPVPVVKLVREELGQHRPYWRIFIDKAELSISEYHHSRSTQNEVKSDFVGVTEEAVNQREKRARGTALQVELRREHKRYHYFARFEEAFLNERTLMDDEPRFLDNFRSNSYQLETGLRKPFRGSIRKRPWIGWLGSFNLSSQVRSPLNRFTLDVILQCPPGVPGCEEQKVTTQIETKAPKTTRFLAKGGLRWEGRQSWLEFGLVGGRVLRPTGYSIVGQGAPAGEACQLGALGETLKGQTIAQCLRTRYPLAAQLPDPGLPASAERLKIFLAGVTAGLSVQTASTSGREAGLFLNFNMRWDLPKGWGFNRFVVENRGRFYFNQPSDTAVDARFMDSLSIGPTLPIYGSLSLKPTYTLLTYKNKVAGKEITGHGFDVKLEYRFDWKSGLESKQVFRYGQP